MDNALDTLKSIANGGVLSSLIDSTSENAATVEALGGGFAASSAPSSPSSNPTPATSVGLTKKRKHELIAFALSSSTTADGILERGTPAQNAFWSRDAFFARASVRRSSHALPTPGVLLSLLLIH